ncbi:hypothetical protein ACFOLF_23295 [Paenibacillus sepulcri]|uniref:Uncharacterized protein n=1 Tax=Paenibacillus sepulcri TaxID=359917 RepID=A0ABS7C378_9BACL|nr:hypothetical protein [Paenibacillus sepulcri]
MNGEYFEEMRKLSHDDDRRHLMLMRGLRMMQEERKNSSFLKKLGKKWGHKSKLEIKEWNSGQQSTAAH